MKQQDEFSRREILQTFGSAAAGLLLPIATVRAEGAPPVFTPPGVVKDLPDEVFDRPRAVFAQRGNFDLDDPRQLALARLKSIFSLDGSKSYVVRLSRALICPPGKAAQTLLHEMLCWYSFIEAVESDGGEPTQVITHSLFTRVAVDPLTFEPLRRLRVPETGQVLDVPDTLFAASVSTDLASGRERRVDAAATSSVEAGVTSPYALMGPDVVFLAKGGHNDEGAHQPQVDMSAWSTPRDELMDPSTASATARYSFSGISRARIFSWAKQYSGSEATQVLTHKIGLKSPTFAGLPDNIKRIMERYYPERI